MPSPAGWREVPCVECGASTPGIDFGERCRSCHKRRARRAGRVARLVSLGMTAGVTAWVVAHPTTSPAARWTGLIAVPATYLLTYLIVSRLAMELLP